MNIETMVKSSTTVSKRHAFVPVQADLVERLTREADTRAFGQHGVQDYPVTQERMAA